MTERTMRTDVAAHPKFHLGFDSNSQIMQVVVVGLNFCLPQSI